MNEKTTDFGAGHGIGCSLPLKVFDTNALECTDAFCCAFGGRDKLLEFLAQQIEFVELRAVDKTTKPDVVANAVSLLNSYGLTTTIHGVIAEANEFFLPYSLVERTNQSFFNITVHPGISYSETIRMLRDICDNIEEKIFHFYNAGKSKN